MRTPRTATAALAAAGILLAGCTGSTPDASPSPSVSASATTSPTASANPTPTSTLSAAQQQAFDEATEVVVAYRQTVVDLYSGARTNLNDLNDVVAAGDLLDADLKAVQKGLNQGWSVAPKGVQVVLVSAAPVKVNLKKDPPTVVVRACIDATTVTATGPDGERNPGKREVLDYTVVKTTYLPDPGWAVSRVQADKDVRDRAC